MSNFLAPCGPGLGGENCDPCSIGAYKGKAGYDACSPCDTGYTTEDEGSDDKSDCEFLHVNPVFMIFNRIKMNSSNSYLFILLLTFRGKL